MIILIRHATPKIDYSSCNYQEARQRLFDYNQTNCVIEDEIKEFIESSFFKKIKDESSTVYCSPIARAEKTCKLLFSNYKINNNLREIDLMITPIPLLKMRVRGWFLISRVVWILGMGNEKEKVIHALNRSKQALDLLKSKKNVVLVSHGYLLHYVKKHLMKKKYRINYKFKKGCFTVEGWS